MRQSASGLDAHQMPGRMDRYASYRAVNTLREPGAMASLPQPIESRIAHRTSPSEIATLARRALELKCASDAGAAQPLLRGKKFGVLCGTDEAVSDDAALFDRAAVELGAQVAHVRPGLTESSAAQDVQQTAYMLGRLYDAVVCDGMDAGLVQRLRAVAGVPVYDHITSPGHPISKAAGLIGAAASMEDNRRFALQALLLDARA